MSAVLKKPSIKTHSNCKAIIKRGSDIVCNSMDSDHFLYLYSEHSFCCSNEVLPQKKETDCLTDGRWTFKEHKIFVDAILVHGNNWKSIQQLIKTRSLIQVRSHSQKFFLKLKKDLKDVKMDAVKFKEVFSLLEPEISQPALEVMYMIPFKSKRLHSDKKVMNKTFNLSRILNLEIGHKTENQIKKAEIMASENLNLSFKEADSPFSNILNLLSKNEKYYSFSKYIYNPFLTDCLHLDDNTDSCSKISIDECNFMSCKKLTYEDKFGIYDSTDVESSFITSFIPRSSWLELDEADQIRKNIIHCSSTLFGSKVLN